jgi:hypothetical protein
MVSLIESMGNHHVVWIDSGGLSVAGIVPDAAALKVDGEVRFDFDSRRISLFDELSEQRL